MYLAEKSSRPILRLAASLSARQIAINVGNDGNEGTGLAEEMGHRGRFLCHRDLSGRPAGLSGPPPPTQAVAMRY